MQPLKRWWRSLRLINNNHSQNLSYLFILLGGTINENYANSG